MRWAFCTCWFSENIFISRFNVFVRFMDKASFIDCFAEEFKKLGYTTANLLEAFSLAEQENIRRKGTEIASLENKLYNLNRFVPPLSNGFTLELDDFTEKFRKVANMCCSRSLNMEDLFEAVDEVNGLTEVYRFPLLTDRTLSRLNRHLDVFDSQGCRTSRPNTMNITGLSLAEIPGSTASGSVDTGGADVDFMNSLFDAGLRSILTTLFPDVGSRLDSYKLFTVEYSTNGSEGMDHDLMAHYDNSEITLNLCLQLSNPCNGGELYFQKTLTDKCSPDFPPATTALDHHPGWVVIHRGSHVHGVHPFRPGYQISRRRSLICWLRSSSSRTSRCPRCFRPPTLEPMKLWHNESVIPCDQLPAEAELEGKFLRVGFGDGFLLPEGRITKCGIV